MTENPLQALQDFQEAERPWVPDPGRARAARTLAKRRRWAQELREAGWKVEEPGGDQGD